MRGSARMYVVRVAQFVLKNSKSGHEIKVVAVVVVVFVVKCPISLGARRSRDLRSPSPVMAPA